MTLAIQFLIFGKRLVFMENDIITLINNIGFPVAVCFYLMKRGEKLDNKLVSVIENNTKALTKLQAELEGLKK